MTVEVSTTHEIPGRRAIEYKGVVRGLIVRSPTIGQGLLGGLKNIIGGKNQSYTQMCEQARQNAYDMMIEHAQEMGANAVVGMRFDTGDISSGNSSITEVLCYGTAIIVK